MSKTDDRELSIKIYQHICNIIGTKEVVKTRRKMFCTLDSLFRIPDSVVISSGSKAEGLDLKGSDYDQMLVVKDFHVYENEDKVAPATCDTPFIMDISDTKPGFTKLKLYNKQHLCYINKYAEIKGGETYFSSKLFRENDKLNGMIIHGPCQSTQNGTYDAVRCLRCEEWITPALKWVFRPRSSWPDHKLVLSVINKGVLFVPIGCKGSVNEELEWRISFSMAEKQLIYSFSHTQLLCYGLMKIMLKDSIKKKHGDLICSYFIKTILFWLFEESSPSEWHPGNMISCFKSCFKRLIYCVEYKVCLHYFIPENNFFECRFSDCTHKCVLDTLNNMYKSLWSSVFDTDTFKSFREEQRISSWPYLTTSSLSCLPYTTMCVPFLCDTNFSRKQIISFIINMNDKELSIYTMSIISKYWMQQLDGNDFIGRNKYVYKQYRKRLQCFKTGLYNDAVSAWSLLASLFYKNKRFHKCKEIIDYTLTKFTSDKIMLSLENSWSDNTYFQKSKEEVGLLFTCKHLIIFLLPFIEPFDLLPVELSPLIAEDASDVRLPPVVYLNILSFLCSNYLGDNPGKLSALKDLKLTIKERKYIHQNKDLLEIAKYCLLLAEDMISSNPCSEDESDANDAETEYTEVPTAHHDAFQPSNSGDVAGYIHAIDNDQSDQMQSDQVIGNVGEHVEKKA